MSVEGSAIFSTATAEPNASRRSASFSPSIWGDHFLSYATDSMPIRKGIPRLEARHYFSIYQEDPSCSEVLLNFAKLDFNILQKQHQKELSEIAKWEITAVDQLPEYMKVTYKALLDVYTEIEENMVSEERSYRVYYAKEAMKNQVRAYYLESKWFHQKHTPTMEEYMAVALVTSAYAMLAATSFVGMGHVVTKDSFDWLFRGPKILKASETICRLMDDIVSHKFEQKRGHVASSIECYMKQHGTTEQETVHEFRKQVTDAWKDVNEEFLHPTAVPMPLLTRMLNLARVIDVVYKDEDGYTNAGTALKDLVSALLIDPVTM
ncbi:hypothetical protein POTOM_003161 [Populus tomentosa]|uniref:Terpene synthase metal-binding domain-containing protein n=1 Tax=Populus tomentosa TaxID=118781 RepID=A0A8X8DL43_POPTO|nr:hypothetical protein POTOM_003161 [Populus tomentosa]